MATLPHSAPEGNLRGARSPSAPAPARRPHAPPPCPVCGTELVELLTCSADIVFCHVCDWSDTAAHPTDAEGGQ